MSRGAAEGWPVVARADTAPELTIDEWFERQDRSVEGAFRVLKRNRARRKKIDADEFERRVAERVLVSHEEAAKEIAIARAVYKHYGPGVMVGDLNELLEEGYERIYSGKNMYNRPVTRFIDRESRSYRPWDDPVRLEVAREMEAERDEARRRIALRRLPKALYPDGKCS